MEFITTSDTEQAALVYNALRNIETEYRSVELAQTGQGKTPTDTYIEQGPGGKTISFQDRMTELEVQHRNLQESNSHVMPTVTELAEQQRSADAVAARSRRDAAQES